MEKKIKELINNKIYFLIEEESLKNKDIIEINLDIIINEIYEKIIYLKDINNLEIYKLILDKYFID